MDPYGSIKNDQNGPDKTELPLPSIVPPLPSTSSPSNHHHHHHSSHGSHHHHPRPPTGKWKDGFCDWYKNCAPSCLMGSFLNCILLGQVAQRMNYCLKFKEVTVVTLGLWGLSYILYSAMPKNAGPGGVSNLIYAIFFLIVLCQLRGIVRARYAIPGDQYCDCCATFWCSCCTLTQMARHLFNYQGSCSECSMGPDAEYLVIV